MPSEMSYCEALTDMCTGSLPQNDSCPSKQYFVAMAIAIGGHPHESGGMSLVFLLVHLHVVCLWQKLFAI